MTQRWDAIVVGGGPAGATLAALLARAGWRIALVDRTRFPRQKVCGEFLGSAMWPVLDRLGVADAIAEQALPIESVELVLPGGRRLSAPLSAAGSRGAIAISRWTFDALLLDAARQAGAEILLEQTVHGVLVEDGRAVGVRIAGTRSPEPDHDLRAPLVIAADGRSSTVVRRTGTLRVRSTRLVGFKRHWRREASATTVPPVLEMHARPRGYVGICPVEPGVVNVCGLMPARLLKQTRGSIDAALERWGCAGPAWSRLLDGTEPQGAWQTTAEVTCQIAEPNVAGVLYVGDAQGTIEPVAGQGMTIALGSAALAAGVLAECGPAGVDRSLQIHYRAVWERTFSRPTGISRRLGWLLRHPAVLRSIVPLFGLAPRAQQTLLHAAYGAMRVELPSPAA